MECKSVFEGELHCTFLIPESGTGEKLSWMATLGSDPPNRGADPSGLSSGSASPKCAGQILMVPWDPHHDPHL